MIENNTPTYACTACVKDRLMQVLAMVTSKKTYLCEFLHLAVAVRGGGLEPKHEWQHILCSHRRIRPRKTGTKGPDNLLIKFQGSLGNAASSKCRRRSLGRSNLGAICTTST